MEFDREKYHNSTNREERTKMLNVKAIPFKEELLAHGVKVDDATNFMQYAAADYNDILPILFKYLKSEKYEYVLLSRMLHSLRTVKYDYKLTNDLLEILKSFYEIYDYLTYNQRHYLLQDFAKTMNETMTKDNCDDIIAYLANEKYGKRESYLIDGLWKICSQAQKEQIKCIILEWYHQEGMLKSALHASREYKIYEAYPLALLHVDSSDRLDRQIAKQTVKSLKKGYEKLEAKKNE